MFQQKKKKKKKAFVVERGFISTLCALKHLAGVIIYLCDVTCFHSSGYICSYLCANVRVRGSHAQMVAACTAADMAGAA